MNNLTTELMKKFHPSVAIVVYKAMDDYYLESHDFNDAGQVLEGKPLKQETISDIIDLFYEDRSKHSSISGIIPENLLHYTALPGGKYEMTWFRHAEQRNLFFTAELGIPSGLSWVPPMIYHVSANSLRVFAILESERPTETTKLFVAPFHNVSKNGDVCLGSARVDNPSTKTYLNLMQYWEQMFWKSEFTHLAGNANPTVNNINLLWKGMITEQRSCFPKDELIQHKDLTIRNFV